MKDIERHFHPKSLTIFKMLKIVKINDILGSVTYWLILSLWGI